MSKLFKTFLSNNEKIFLDEFEKLNLNYRIVPQISLNSIFYDYTNKKWFSSNFCYIVDFVVFTNDFKETLAIIEINGKEHKYIRKKTNRDNFIEKICNKRKVDFIIIENDDLNNPEKWIDKFKNLNKKRPY